MTNQPGPESVKDRVARILAEEIAPALEMDGTSIEVVDVHEGVVRVRFHDGCCSCPSSIMTIVFAMEQELRRRIPDMEYLEAVP